MLILWKNVHYAQACSDQTFSWAFSPPSNQSGEVFWLVCLQPSWSSLTAFFFSGEGAFLPKWPLFLHWREVFFAACVVFPFFLFLSFFLTVESLIWTLWQVLLCCCAKWGACSFSLSRLVCVLSERITRSFFSFSATTHSAISFQVSNKYGSIFCLAMTSNKPISLTLKLVNDQRRVYNTRFFKWCKKTTKHRLLIKVCKKGPCLKSAFVNHPRGVVRN